MEKLEKDYNQVLHCMRCVNKKGGCHPPCLSLMYLSEMGKRYNTNNMQFLKAYIESDANISGINLDLVSDSLFKIDTPKPAPAPRQHPFIEPALKLKPAPKPKPVLKPTPQHRPRVHQRHRDGLQPPPTTTYQSETEYNKIYGSMNCCLGYNSISLGVADGAVEDDVVVFDDRDYEHCFEDYTDDGILIKPRRLYDQR